MTLNLLHPCQSEITQGRLCQKVNYDSHTKPREYVIGDAVWIRNFRSGSCWIAVTIKKHISRVMYEVSIDGKNVVRMASPCQSVEDKICFITTD